MIGGGPFEVIWSAAALEDAKSMEEWVIDPERRTELALTLNKLDSRLRIEPSLLGEIYRHRGGVAEHLAALHKVAIDFAIDYGRRLVLVRHAYGLKSVDEKNG